MWHYQFLKRTILEADELVDYITLHEVYNTEGKYAHTDSLDQPGVWGENQQEVKDTLEMIQKDLERYGVLDYNTFTTACKEGRNPYSKV